MSRHPFEERLLERPRSGRARRLLALGAVWIACVGCAAQPTGSTDGGPPPQSSTNSCFAGAPCLGGFCDDDGFCRSETTSVRSLLLEITPPADTPSIAGVRFIQPVSELPASGRLDLNLGQISHVEMVVVGTAVPEGQCVPPAGEVPNGTAADGTMAARVTLIPREKLVGLSSPTYLAQQQPGESSSYLIDLVAPPGRYDIHVEPLGVDGDCVRSPYLVVDQELAPGEVALNLELPIPAKLDLSVVFPGYLDVLSGWEVDIVDRTTGKVLSNQVALSDPVGLGGQLEYRAALAFSPVEREGSVPAMELIRLSPPAEVAAPTIYLERSVVELFAAGEGVIDQLTMLPSPVTYTGRMNRDAETPAPGVVTLVATDLASIDAGLIAAFSRTVQTDQAGVFEVDLLPGKYQVLMAPHSEELAQTVTELTVSGGADTQAGKVLEVGLRASVVGSLVTVAGAPVLGVPIEAYPPAPSTSPDVLTAARGIAAIVPRAEAVLVVDSEGQPYDNGTFSLLADPGSFHLIARPEASTGFAWGFTLGLDVAGADIGLPDIVLSPPFVVEGNVSSSEVGPLPGSLVRAYAYVEGTSFSGDAEDATSIVAVGEARVDEEGRYRLLLPSVDP